MTIPKAKNELSSSSLSFNQEANEAITRPQELQKFSTKQLILLIKSMYFLFHEPST